MNRFKALLKSYPQVLIGLALSTSLYGYEFESLANEHILAGYQKLLETTNNLNHSVNKLCKKADTSSLNNSRSHYREAFSAWQSIQHIRFGPIQYLSREYRFELWPDKRGTVSKHLTRLLKESMSSEGGFEISEKSVAVQGFPALERILFDQKPITEKQCRVIREIGKNLSTMSVGIIDDWTKGKSPYVDFILNPGPHNLIFETEQALANRLLNSLYTQLEFMVTQKLDRPLGKSISKARGKQAEGWRSQMAITALHYNLQATRQLYIFAFAAKLTPDLERRIDHEYQQAKQTLSYITMPLKSAVTDATQREHILEFRRHLSNIKRIVATELTTELGLSLGFNSLDGD
ncbi:MAG: imelysin family protein [Candidatus Thiodiazotropha sp. DIVDIV]